MKLTLKLKISEQTGIQLLITVTWANANGGSVNDAPEYITVEDSLKKSEGGNGLDYLVDIEKVQFDNKTYFLEIQDLSLPGEKWVSLLGTSGNDVFTTFTNDKTGADKVYNINGGAGDDLIIGGVEPQNKGFVEGDTAVYEAASKFFEISVEEYTFKLALIKPVIANDY